MEKITDNTELFEEAENLKDPIDLDGYVKYQKLINDDRFIELVMGKDIENKKNGLYKEA